jgi:oligoendopeptidase F
MHAARQEYEAKLTELEHHCALLHSDIPASDFLAMLERMEALHRIRQRIFTYAELLSHENALDESIGAFRSEIAALFSDGINREASFWNWWKSLDDMNAQRLAEQAPAYSSWLRDIRSQETPTPSAEVGAPVTPGNKSVLPPLINQYDRLATQARMAGNEHARHQHSPDRDVRAHAHEGVRRVLGGQAEEFAAIYSDIVRAWHRDNLASSATARPITAANRANEIEDEVIDELLQSCRRNAFVFRRFLHYGASTLDVTRLRLSDLTAPSLSTFSAMDFPAASEKLLEAYREFDAQLEILAERVFSERHVESVSGGQRIQGGLSSSVGPDTTSWVTLPYYKTFESMSLLAHELGHAVHFMLVDHHSDLMHRASHLVGETAAAFSEILFFEHVLRGIRDAGERKALLTSRLITLNQAILTPAYTVLFEIEAHQLVHQGTSANALSQLYRSKLIEQYGDSTRVDRHFGFDWMRTPHIFHDPFSVYVYPFGQLLALALYQRYRAEDQEFVGQYFGALRGGGRTRPHDLLNLVIGGDPLVDVWQTGFDAISDMVNTVCDR